MRRVRRVVLLVGIAVGLTVPGFALGVWIDDAQQVGVYRSTPDWKRMKANRPGLGDVFRTLMGGPAKMTR